MAPRQWGPRAGERDRRGMDQRLTAANAALAAGNPAEAIDHIIAVLSEAPDQTVQVYRVLVIQLHRAERWEEGEHWARAGLERHPRDFDLWNILGVMLRRQRRFPEALAALDQASKIAPKNAAAQSNRGNILLDMAQGARAEAVFAKLVRQEPRSSEFQRQLGRALRLQGRRDQALVRFRQAVSLKKDNVDAWLDIAHIYNDEGRTAEAEETLGRAIQAVPGEERLIGALATVMRKAGEPRRAEALLLDLLPTRGGEAWIHHQIGCSISDWDRDRANDHFRKAVAFKPDSLDYNMALIESLERTRTGDEGANIEEAYQLAKTVLPRTAEFGDTATKILTEVFIRVAAFEEANQLGTFKSLGRGWVETGRHTALLRHLARVESDEDREELVEQHRIWGRKAEAAAAKNPIQRPAPRPAGGKIRLGLMSSDLRRHPVGYFVLPLFDHIDNERFEVFVYSYYQGEEDQLQKYITEKVHAYRWWPEISPRGAAQAIAEDQLDLLIELGGSTHMNKLEVMAYRPAPLQASWLGYPHSSGLSTIDYLVVDPYLTPDPQSLMIEAPMSMPSSWIALGKLAFPEGHVINPQPPHARRGFITFGTANNSYKYTPAALTAWAKIVASVPDSRFVFVRPEGSAPSFRTNLIRYFTDAGVAAERVEFIPVRGAHMQHYNSIDIALDTFPQTGGTTTCEAAWMGVPTVSLVGKAVYERLSYSILVNAGLGELCTWSLDEYVAKAVALAADPARITTLRATLREQLKTSPLGRTDVFARDFYDLVAKTVAGARKA
jgi:protein O-GlcNAc transferase